VDTGTHSSEHAPPRLAFSLCLDLRSGRPMLAWLEGKHAGVAAGDLLLSVNGQRPATVEAAETLLLKASRSGRTIDLEVCHAPCMEAEAQRGHDPPLASLDGTERGGDSGAVSERTSVLPDRISPPWCDPNKKASIQLGNRTTGYL